jgi:sulfur carrier protein ThiS adenylyltransferase
VPADRLATCAATVIGVGAVGRQVALQLAAMGVPYLQLVDFDSVEKSNLASQGYLERDLGDKKVTATGDLCRRVNSWLVVEEVPTRFRRSTATGNTVFCCVDSITDRRHIWDTVRGSVNFFCDARMAAEAIRVLTAGDAAGRAHYPATLFTAAEAYVGSCTAKTTIYCANIAAGIMLSQFTKYLRDLPLDPDIQLNLIASELSAILL